MNELYLILSLLILTLIILFIRCICFSNNEKFEDTSISIPKVIYLTHKDNIPDFVIENWKRLNPDYKIKFYNDAMCRQFIIDNYPETFVNYFDKLSKHKGSGPIKSDFWRVLILYKYGGVYADSDIELLKPISFFLESETDFLTCNSMFKKSLNPHLIISRPRNIILEKCINIYQTEKFNTKYSYWGHSIVHIMRQAFNILNIKYYSKTEVINSTFENNNYKIQLLLEKVSHGFVYFHDSINVKCYYKNTVVLNNRFKEYDSYSHIYKN